MLKFHEFITETPLTGKPIGATILEFPTLQEFVAVSRLIVPGMMDSPEFQPDPAFGDYFMFAGAFIVPDTAYVWDRTKIFHALAWQTITEERPDVIKGAPVYLMLYDDRQLVVAPSAVSWNDGPWTNKRRLMPDSATLTQSLKNHTWIQSLGVTVHGVEAKGLK